MAMAYAIKEIFPTLQGEGYYAGRTAVFCRFAGCNLWTGLERDRDSAVCQFCDTDFVGTDGDLGGKYASAADLAEVILETWPAGNGRRFVVLTGGEPMLQVDAPLLSELHERGFEVACETNGTRLAPDGIDWVCVSPKAQAPLEVFSGDELKLVFPQVGIDPADFAQLDFSHFFLQPMDGPNLSSNTADAIAYCSANPQWRLSVQAHKIVGIR